ncbi:putative aminoacyltransferase, E1 ubiquitin-activating enzyme [Rosa chinensis]|uniref:Putative aminoacyltransferase, E1 ubiquitin-activating enzyme n=2 Tax=Rosa chinensis TaxID=74649 RepID=A0A2P6SC03_ROSCH|nr:putative aminoacyltransferase, E1 ubiquitin-activating enzyme [Rosa chinensis]
MSNELDVLQRSTMGYANGQSVEFRAFFERCNFLKLIYENYLSVKDEVIYAAVDARVKNIAETYFLQHQNQILVFDHLFKLLISSIQNEENIPSKVLLCFTGSLQTMFSQCMAKEEEQIIPLLIQKFSVEEQASLVWKLLSSIPTNIVAKLIPWLASSLSLDECQHLYKCLSMIVPAEKLLQEVIFTWMEGKDNCAGMTADRNDDTSCAYEFNGVYPIDDMLIWHHAIETELNETLAEEKKMSISGDVINYDLLAFYDRLQFIAEICMFHSIAEETVLYPAVYGEISIFHEHRNEVNLTNEFRYLLESLKSASTIPSTAAKFHSKICSCADQIMTTLKAHFHDEEVKVLPLVRKHLSIKRQQELLHQSLCVMPLKLIERVLPWLVKSLTANEAQNFVNNMQLAAPASDIALVQLFCGWASKASNDCLCSSSSLYIKSMSPSHSVCEKSNSCSTTGIPAQPIDVVFKVHKAIHRDLEYLDTESERLSNCDEIFLQQFIESFCLLWGLYRAHSNAEDFVLYPAMESRDALQNVSHSYTLDHKQEEDAFENISGVLLELSHLHRGTRSGAPISECVGKYYELANKLRIMFMSLRMMVDEHMYREELELWPLFGAHFSVEEQNKMIGFILGTTGAEVLQSMLPWVTSALTEDEWSKMMDTFKNVTKNTMFKEWLGECGKGSSLSTLPPKPETSIFIKGTGFEESHHQIDHTFNSHTRNNLKHQMTSYWIAAQQSLTIAIAVDSSNSEQLGGLSPTFRDHEKTVYGCQHYKRNCKLLAVCCGKLFTCRFCHDIMSDHPMDRKATSKMMCMSCLNIQPVGSVCSTASCNGFPMAKYYCNICNLFDDDRNVYHCPFCNLCRVGKGLGIDYFHCMSCNCCMGMASVNHKCQEKCLETNCPVCNEFLFTSSSRIKALPCGHCMHLACFKTCTQSNSPYTCPVCSRSSGATMMTSTQSSLLVDGDETMEFYSYDQKTEMTSCTDINPEGRFFMRTSLWVNILYQLVLWFEHLDGRLVLPRFLQRLKRGLENGVAGQKAKERCVSCCVVLCGLVLFCVLSTLLILLGFKALGRDKYIQLL